MFKHWLVFLFGLFSKHSYRHENVSYSQTFVWAIFIILQSEMLNIYVKVRKGIWPRNYNSSSTSIGAAKRLKCVSIQIYVHNGCMGVWVCVSVCMHIPFHLYRIYPWKLKHMVEGHTCSPHPKKKKERIIIKWSCNKYRPFY